MRRGRIGLAVDISILLVALAGLFAIGPLLLPGYFWGAHDARHSVYFLFEFDRSIQEGILYPRWSPDFAFGYGYPFFNIYAPLAFYIGEGFHLLGLGFEDAVKAVFGLALMLSGLGMYGFLRRPLGRRGALLAAVAYMYVPYHLFDMYVRAALAESVALAVIPWVLWGFHETVWRPRFASVAGAGLAYAALMLSSNLITLLFTPLLAVYLAVMVISRLNDEQPLRGFSKESILPACGHLLHRAIPPLIALCIGLGLSAIFWIPAVLENRYVRADQWLGGSYDYHDDFVYFFQLFSPFWGFGVSGAGPEDGVGFQLGAAPLALAFLSLLIWWRLRSPEARRLWAFAWVGLVGAVFMALPPAVAVWERVSFTRYAQFPWRYFSLAAPLLAVLAGTVLAEPEEPAEEKGPWPRELAMVLLAGLVIWGSYPYVRAEIREPKEGPVSLAGLMRFQRTANEMTGSTIWTKEIPQWSPMADLFVNGQDITTRVDYSWVPQNEILAVDARGMTSISEKVWVWAADDQQSVRFYRFYYPGWKAYILDEQTEKVIAEAPIYTTGPQGLITVPVPQGRHLLLLRFEDTPPRRVGQALSAVTLAGLALAALARWRLMRGRAG